MQNNNSKLNTFLLIILVILACIIIWIEWHDRKADEGKDAYLGNYQEEKNTQPTEKLAFCPEVKVINLMPSVPSPENPPSEYYSYKRKRYEISEFDANWVKNNCNVKEEKVY